MLKYYPGEKYLKLENVAITVVLPRAASRCAGTRSHYTSLVRPLARTLSNSLSRLHSLEFALARLAAHWLALARPPIGSHSLELAFKHAILAV